MGEERVRVRKAVEGTAAASWGAQEEKVAREEAPGGRADRVDGAEVVRVAGVETWAVEAEAETAAAGLAMVEAVTAMVAAATAMVVVALVRAAAATVMVAAARERAVARAVVR